jgi:polyhydroxyalkanoate synthesis regulator phasin
MNDKEKPAATKNTNDNAEIKDSVTAKKTITTPATANEKKANKTTLSSRILLILLVFIAGMALSVYLMPTLKERLPFVANWIGTDSMDEVSVLGQRLDAQQTEINALRGRINELERDPVLSSANNDVIIPSDLEERIAVLEALASEVQSAQEDTVAAAPIDTSQSGRIDMLLSRMSQLEASFVPLSQNMLDAGQAREERRQLANENVSLSDKLANLESRLGSVEQIATKDNSGILLNLKIADLKRSFERGTAYTADIATISRIINSSPLAENVNVTNAITTLNQKSTSGIITIEQSTRVFNSLIPQILKQEDKDPDASWVQNTLSALKNMITVRQTDMTSPDASNLDNMISQIELNLLGRNPDEAAKVADDLPAAIKNILTPWRSDLQSLIDGREAIILLEKYATENYLINNNANSEITGTAS